MFNPFLLNKTSPIKGFSSSQGSEAKKLTGLIVNPNSMSNEQFFMLIQEISDSVDDDMDSNNIISFEDGSIQITFQFLSKLNPHERSYLSKKDIVILLLNIDEEDANEQFNFLQDYLRETDPNSGGMKNTQLFFFIQNFSYNIHDNYDFEYQISEMLTEYPFVNNFKVSSDNSKTLNKSFKPSIIQFANQDKSSGWNPITANDEEQEDQNRTSRNVLDQLDQYKQNRNVSQSPPIQSKKSIFEIPLVSIVKQQQEEKRAEEEAQKALLLQQEQLLSSRYTIQQKSTSKLQSSQNFYESPLLSSTTKKRDEHNSLVYQNSSNKKTETDSPLKALRYYEDISDHQHQIKLKVSPFKREITQNYTYPKITGEKEPPIFKTSLMNGEDEDDLMSYSIQKNSNNNSPKYQKNQQASPSQFRQSQQETRNKQDYAFKNHQDKIDSLFLQNDKQFYQLQPPKREVETQNRAKTPNLLDKPIFVNGKEKPEQMVRNKSSLGIRQSHTAQQERSTTPNRLTHNKSQKQIVASNTTSSNCIMKLNIEVQNRIVQIEVEEHDTPHSLTYKLLQKCNQSGQLKQVKQLTQLIEQKMKKYLTNVDKYFKNHSKPQITYMCKQNRQILQDLTENDYIELEKKKKQTYYTGFGGTTQFDRTPDKFTNNTSTFGQINNRQSYSNLITANKSNQYPPSSMPQSMLQSMKFIGEIQIEGNVNGQLQNLSLQISENVPPEIQADQFLNEYNLGNDIKEQIIQQIQQIQNMHRQTNIYSELFQENREQISFIKELKAKYRFDNNVLFQNIQKSSSITNNFRVNLELENGKMVKFNFSDTDNLPKIISIFCINHKLSAKNKQKLQSICEQSIKYYKETQQQKRQLY